MKNIMFILLLSLIVCGSANSAILVHQWSFDDNLLDTSGSGNDGTFTGATETYVAGVFGNSISLAAGDGVDNVEASLGNANLAGNSISLNTWLKMDAVPANLSYLGGIGSRADLGKGTVRAFLQFQSGYYFWGNSHDANSGVPYSADSEWHMYTITLDFDGEGNVTYSFYLDGDGSFYTPVTIEDPGYLDVLTEVGVGGTSLWGATWTGAMDEFTVWDGTLTQSEVLDLYNSNGFVSPIPVSPLNGENLVGIDTILEWASSEIYVSTDYELYLRANDPNFNDTANNIIDGVSVTPVTPTTTYPVTLDFETTYYWRVDASDGSEWYTGGPWKFTTTPQIPVVIEEPLSQAVDAGDTVVFTVDHHNGTSFEWYFNDSKLSDGGKYSGAATTSLTITDVQKDEEGSYHCKIINDALPEGVESAIAGLWTKRLIAHWDFDDDMIDTVDSWVGVYSDPNEANTPAAGTEVYDDNSISGKSLQLTNDELHVRVTGSETAFSFTPVGQTVSVWVNTSNSGVYQSPISKKVDNLGWALYTPNIDGAVARVGWGETGWLDISGGPGITDSSWHLLVHQYDPASKTLKLFVDGKLVAESAETAPAMEITAPLMFGTDESIGSWPWVGLIDEVNIWSYALDPYEIAHLYTDVMTDAKVCVEQIGLEFDISGPLGEPDCLVDLYDFAEFAATWLNCNMVPDCK